MMNQINKFLKEEKGQGMTEYGLILGLIAVVVAVSLTTMGDTIKSKFNEVITKLGGNPNPPANS